MHPQEEIYNLQFDVSLGTTEYVGWVPKSTCRPEIFFLPGSDPGTGDLGNGECRRGKSGVYFTTGPPLHPDALNYLVVRGFVASSYVVDPLLDFPIPQNHTTTRPTTAMPLYIRETGAQYSLLHVTR